VLSLRKPSAETIRRFLNRQADLPFTYEGVGTTADTPPAGYVVDRTRIQLGTGEAAFDAAVAALRRWEQFRLGWVQVGFPETPIEVGQVVAVMGQAVGMWWTNACRIVYTVDEPGPSRKFGFAYGTLPGHVERGEERFMLEWNPADDSVWYSILAFSRPNRFSSRIGYPVVRRLQRRFGQQSAAAMLRAVTE
jgi:uncharacterized protein (UPF0548 family)